MIGIENQVAVLVVPRIVGVFGVLVEFVVTVRIRAGRNEHQLVELLEKRAVEVEVASVAVLIPFIGVPIADIKYGNRRTGWVIRDHPLPRGCTLPQIKIPMVCGSKHLPRPFFGTDVRNGNAQSLVESNVVLADFERLAGYPARACGRHKTPPLITRHLR